MSPNKPDAEKFYSDFCKSPRASPSFVHLEEFRMGARHNEFRCDSLLKFETLPPALNRGSLLTLVQHTDPSSRSIAIVRE